MDHTATDESPGAFRYTMETAPGARLAALSAALRTQDGVEVTERDGRTFLSVKFPLRDPEYSHEMQRLNQGYQLGEHTYRACYSLAISSAETTQCGFRRIVPLLTSTPAP